MHPKRRHHLNAIMNASDDNGIISPQRMVYLFPGEPTKHTYTQVLLALQYANCTAFEAQQMGWDWLSESLEDTRGSDFVHQDRAEYDVC